MKKYQFRHDMFYCLYILGDESVFHHKRKNSKRQLKGILEHVKSIIVCFYSQTLHLY